MTGLPAAGTVATEMVPLAARLLFQVTPVPPPEMVIVGLPEMPLLNKVNVSPTTRVGPRLVTITETVPLPVRVPCTIALPLVGERDLLRVAVTFPERVTLLLVE